MFELKTGTNAFNNYLDAYLGLIKAQDPAFLVVLFPYFIFQNEGPGISVLKELKRIETHRIL